MSRIFSYNPIMKNLLKNIIIMLSILGMSGCEIDLSNKEEIETLKEENQKLLKLNISMETNRSTELDKRQLEYQNRENLAKIAMQERVAQLNQAKELEALKLQTALAKEELGNKQQRELERIRMQSLASKDMRDIEQQRYVVAISALLIIIIALFVYLYFKRRREDKLRAYNDNLDKYFRSKENEARVKIAQKILDTVSSGNLSPSHEAKLIGVFNDHKKRHFQDDKLLDNQDNSKVDDTQDAEIVS